MSYRIEIEHRKILDAILPYFLLNEVINVRVAIREVLAKTPHALANIPVNLYSDVIKKFLIKYKFARSLTGEALINQKGMALKNAGSLNNFERLKLKKYDFIVIDDDTLNNIVCQKTIEKVSPGSQIKTFTDPNLALRCIYDTYANDAAGDVVLLLDINMPTLLGWDVLAEFDCFPESIKKHFRIFMLSSSINPADIDRAEKNLSVWGYITKPLTEEKVKLTLFHDEYLEPLRLG